MFSNRFILLLIELQLSCFLIQYWIILHWNISFDDLYKKLNEIEVIIKQYLKLDDFRIQDNIEFIDKHIFPDTIVINDIEVYSSHYFIVNEILRNWGIINYLTNNEVNYIKNMNSEKYRKELFNKKNGL